MKRVFLSQLQRNTSWKKQLGVGQVPEDKDLKNPNQRLSDPVQKDQS